MRSPCNPNPQWVSHGIESVWRRARSRDNPLFAVNYMDREVRKDVANHVRQTTRGARNVKDPMNRLAIYRVMHTQIPTIIGVLIKARAGKID